jgi:hypothetical protein
VQIRAYSGMRAQIPVGLSPFSLPVRALQPIARM